MTRRYSSTNFMSLIAAPGSRNYDVHVTDNKRTGKWQSGAITDGPSRAGARSMLRAAGFDREALARPIVGIANTWTEIGPCNLHLRELAASVKEGVRAAGGTPMEFNTVSISDGITMGSAGMRASLVSREVIADSIELVARGNLFDGLVVLVGCDKTIPAAAMVLARLDLPGLILYGGSIAPGQFEGRDVTIQDVYEAIGANAIAPARRRLRNRLILRSPSESGIINKLSFYRKMSTWHMNPLLCMRGCCGGFPLPLCSCWSRPSSSRGWTSTWASPSRWLAARTPAGRRWAALRRTSPCFCSPLRSCS